MSKFAFKVEVHMTDRRIFEPWILEAIKEHNGKARVWEVAKHIWDNHESQIRARGNTLYTWQYDVRWAAEKMRKAGVLKEYEHKDRGYWLLP